MPFDPRSPAIVDASRAVFESLGCRTEERSPTSTDAREVFLTFRAHGYAADLGELLASTATR